MLLTSLIAGLVMGAASSLHCAGMCGPIGCALLVGAHGEGRLDPALSLFATQLGRIVSYMTLGGIVGTLGAGVSGLASLPAMHLIFQWTAALTVIWIGLSVAGLVPALAGADRLLAPLALRLTRLRLAWTGGYPQLAVSGLLWGALPCGMVYGALVNAAIAGTPLAGITLMGAFGLGTLPAVALSSFAAFRLGRRHRSPLSRAGAGAALVALGLLGLVLVVPGSPLCITSGT